MRIAVLGSGSKGNCLVIDGGGTIVLVDAGFGPRETRARLRSLDLDLQDVGALLITHAHGDHIKGAKQLAASLGIPTFATDATVRFASAFTSLRNVRQVVPGEAFQVGGLCVRPTKTHHDEPGSVCYAIDDGDEAFGICTDLGDPSDEVAAGLRGVDTLMLEFNHDRDMLQRGPYPAKLKRRVGSRFGHLNNDDAQSLLARARSTSLSRVLCAHLSEVNNTPALALAAARAAVEGADVQVAVAPQHAPTSWLRVRRRGTDPASASRRSTPNGRPLQATPSAHVDPAQVPPPPAGPAPSPSSRSDAVKAASVDTPSQLTPAQLDLRAKVKERQLALFGKRTEQAPPSSSSTTTTAQAARPHPPLLQSRPRPRRPS